VLGVKAKRLPKLKEKAQAKAVKAGILGSLYLGLSKQQWGSWQPIFSCLRSKQATQRRIERNERLAGIIDRTMAGAGLHVFQGEA